MDTLLYDQFAAEALLYKTVQGVLCPCCEAPPDVPCAYVRGSRVAYLRVPVSERRVRLHAVHPERVAFAKATVK